MTQQGALAASLTGRYSIERELGAGGMATVYLAEDVRHRRKVALKVLRPELAAVIGAARFLKEIETTANLQHPHILPLHDSGEVNGTAFYVMPFVEGESLRDRLTREKVLPIDDALRITKEVASALNYAHRHGVIHRDIKPENVLLHDGQAVVADFGIALAAATTGSTRMTETGMSLGTPTYMSPEQAMGERSLDGRTDIYALGCVLYEMLTGEPPFTGATAQAIVAKVMTERPAPILPRRSRVPAHVENAVFVALEKLPADRFATAADFIAALDAQRSVAVPARQATKPDRSLIAWSGWAAAALLAAFAAWSFTRDAPAAHEAMTRRVSIQVPMIGDYRNPRAPFALSHDGSVIVYAAIRGPTAAIHRRWMQELQSEPIRGTEGGVGPFISPDGKQLGFFRGNQMHVVPVAGGPSTLVRAVVMAEGTPNWTDDGRIVYTNGAGGLVLTTPDGSRVDTLTRPTGRERHLSPIALPGSRTVLYMAAGADINDSRIEALTIGTSETRTVMGGGALTPQYVDGYLFFARAEGADATLFALPFDAEKAAARGEPVSLGDPINRSRFGTAQYAAASGVLLYHPRSETVLVESDPRGVTTRLVTENGSWHHPRYSPDGSRVLLDLAEVDGRDVWVYDRGSKTLSRVTRLGDAHDPSWLPNGREVSFFSFKSGGFPLHVAAADGSSEPRAIEHKVTFNPTDLVTPGSWLPDGRSYVGGVNDPSSLGDIWLIPLDGSQAQRVVGSRFEEQAPAVSADGRWLAYQSNETGRIEVYVRSLKDAAFRVQVSNAGGMGPMWDRQRPIVYYMQLTEGRLDLVSATIRSSPLSVMSRETVLNDVAIELSDNHANFDVHPSGKLFVFPREEPTTGLVAIFDWMAALRGRKGS